MILLVSQTEEESSLDSLLGELGEEAIVHIKSLPWSSRKRIGYELYLRGFSYPEIGSIIGRESDPYNPDSRQRVEQLVNPTQDDKQLHGERRGEREIEKRIVALCTRFGVAVDALKSAVDPNYQHMDVLRLSALSGYPRELISRYLEIKDMQALSTGKADLFELKTLYEHGFDISSGNMQRHSPHTSALYMRVSSSGRDYMTPLRQIGVNPEAVYKRRRRKSFAKTT